MSMQDYLGRTVDVVAYDGIITEYGLAELEMVLAQPGAGGKIITGVAKLMQRFILRLYTIRGSLQFLPNEGCQFIADARGGRLRTVTDVFASFSASVSDIREQFSAEQRDSDPADEIFSAAELLAVDLTGDRLRISILLTTAAGTSAKFLAPLDIAL